MNRTIKSKRKSSVRSLFIYTLLPVALLLSSRWLGDYFPSSFEPHAQTNNAQQPLNEATLTTAQLHNVEDWKLILVNRDNPVPAGYEIDRVLLDSGQYVDQRIYPDLQKMMDAARHDGVYPLVTSGYRTNKVQRQLMDERVQKYKEQGHSSQEARTLAESWVAIPGTSEHELGIAVDINADKKISTNEEVYAWLHANSHRYGFILRYPSDKTDITGVSYEPWHFRYVGSEAATEIYELGLSLEEYVLQMAYSVES